MIKNINANGRFIQISGGGSAHVSVSNGSNMSGNVRWNMNSQNLEVYDGSTWISIGKDVHMDISPQVYQMLDWVEKKMHEDRRIQHLVDSNPTVADAYATYKDAADKLRVVIELTKKEDHHNVQTSA